MFQKRNLGMANYMLSCLVLFFMIATPAVYATTWNIQNDFSITSNPNGAYSYGWVPSPGGEFSVYDKTDEGISGCEGIVIDWHSSSITWSRGPVVAKNITSSSSCNGIQPGEVNIHPGPDGQFSVIRWTSPVAGIISINGYFGAGDSGIMSYFIYKDGTIPIFTIHQASGDGPFSLVEDVSVGSTIDFMVGEGFYYGSTPLHAEITALEEETCDLAPVLNELEGIKSKLDVFPPERGTDGASTHTPQDVDDVIEDESINEKIDALSSQLEELKDLVQQISIEVGEIKSKVGTGAVIKTKDLSKGVYFMGAEKVK